MDYLQQIIELLKKMNADELRSVYFFIQGMLGTRS